jgi:hypothetical protein
MTRSPLSSGHPEKYVNYIKKCQKKSSGSVVKLQGASAMPITFSFYRK